MNISIFGLGYVGAVSAACLADLGHRVWGVDINPEKVDLINVGKSTVVEPGLGKKLARVVREGWLVATTDGRQAVSQSEVTFVVVATPSGPSGEIDPTHLYRACKEIALSLKSLSRPQTVVIRSSVLPDIFKGCQAIFEKHAPELVELCTNPEFLREGVAIADFEKPSFTVIGVQSERSERQLREIYRGIAAPIFVLPPREAVMVKYASNVFHALKVTFTNEMGALCKAQGIDSNRVMDTFTQDTRLNISSRYLHPGFAFGGSCLPKDTRAVVQLGKNYRVSVPVISSIMRSNKDVIDRAFERIMSFQKTRIGLIGLSFKPNSDDLRESPLVTLATRLLATEGIDLKVFDPNVAASSQNEVGREIVERTVPWIDHILVTSLSTLIRHGELLVVGHGYKEVTHLANQVAPETVIIDLANVVALRSFNGVYDGINW